MDKILHQFKLQPLASLTNNIEIRFQNISNHKLEARAVINIMCGGRRGLRKLMQDFVHQPFEINMQLERVEVVVFENLNMLKL